MAREKIVRVTSDLTGTAYEGEDFPPVKISVNGKTGQRDLTPAEAEALETFAVSGDATALRKLLAPEPAPAAHRPGSRRRSRGTSSRAADSGNAAIREWWGSPDGRKATDTGADFVIPERGRIPQTVKDAYHAAHGQASPASEPESAGNAAA